MIIDTIDQGWGPEHPLKAKEMAIIEQYLRPYREDSSRTVVINSTWYDDDLKIRLQARFQLDPPDRVVLSSLLDSAIARVSDYQALAGETRAMGYYAGPDWIDFWSLVVDDHMTWPGINLLDPQTIDRSFMCLNRKPHAHRQRLYDLMRQADLLDQGLVSMGGWDGRAQRLLDEDSGTSDLAPNGGPAQNGIANDIVTLGHPRNWQRHFLNIVTETEYDVSGTTFVTEKIYKPVLGLRPFLVYAPDGARAWLTEHGFHDYLQDFQDITDLDLANPTNLVPFLGLLAQQGPVYWRKKFIDLQHKILYNRKQFDLHVAQQRQKIIQGIQCQI